MAAESLDRLIHPVAIGFDHALLVTVAGLVVNAASMLILGGAPGGDAGGGHAGHAHAGHERTSACLDPPPWPFTAAARLPARSRWLA